MDSGFISAPNSAVITMCALHYIALHSMDPKLVKMTVGCGIYNINTKTYVQYN
jgi:hypothetical protein